ncbi:MULTISPECIES: gas vesicle protein [unclassified Streptomyces]|uniref:gas vesicle protein GvpO n=1 Tax=unclassified Streptomyces TaxID=2593676 RepID=UPI003824EF96
MPTPHRSGDDHGTPARPRAKRPAPSRGTHDAARAMRSAAARLQELLGRTPESVTALRRTADGWEADVDVVELERVPETTSVLGSYHVTLDHDGELVGYERTRRYTRGQIDRPG